MIERTAFSPVIHTAGNDAATAGVGIDIGSVAACGAQSRLPSATTPGVYADGSLTEAAARERRWIAHCTHNHHSTWDRGFSHFILKQLGGLARGLYFETVGEVFKMITPPLSLPGFLQKLAPDWHDKPAMHPLHWGLATFTDDEVVRVEGHHPQDVVVETTVLIEARRAGTSLDTVQVKVVNGKAVLPFGQCPESDLDRTTATTCHCMILLDKRPNAFTDIPMPQTADQLKAYLSRIPGAGVPARYHFDGLPALESALKAHGPLVLQTCHRVALDWDEEAGDDERFVEGKTLTHYVVLDKIENGLAHIRDPAWNRIMHVKVEALLRVPDGADLTVESKYYGCYEILEARAQPATTARRANEVKPHEFVPAQAGNTGQAQATIVQQAAVIERLQATVAAQAVRIAELEAKLAALRQ